MSHEKMISVAQQSAGEMLLLTKKLKTNCNFDAAFMTSANGHSYYN